MKVYCLHTLHYTAVGTVGVTVAPAGSVINNLSREDFDELEKLGSVRAASATDEAAFAEAVKLHGGKLPGARSPTPGKGKPEADLV